MFPFFEGEVQLLAYDVIVTNLPPIDTKYVLSMCLVSIFPTAAAHLPRDFQCENNKLGVVASKRHICKVSTAVPNTRLVQKRKIKHQIET
jgi:hypothetical protein